MVPPSGLTSPPGAPGGGAPNCAGAGCAPPGGATPPTEGGATPIIVPLSFGLGSEAAGAGAAAGGAPGIAPGAAAGGAPGAPGTLAAFIISIVPLNFGAELPFRLNPHFWQVVAVSGFWAPQLGQNTQFPPVVHARKPSVVQTNSSPGAAQQLPWSTFFSTPARGAR